jgi:murein DD-endopeptidase MepM/ murein hydrolase activator NlpD
VLPRFSGDSVVNENEEQPKALEVSARSDVAPTEGPPVSPRMHAVLWLAIGCALVGAVQVPMAILAHDVPPAASIASVAPAASTATPIAPPAPSAVASSVPSAVPPLVEEGAGPPPFRIAQLESDAIDVTAAKVGKRTCPQTLAALAVDPGELARLATAIAPLRTLEGCNPTDRVVVATRKADKKLVAFELETAPGEIVRVMERALKPGDAGAPSNELVAEQITLPVTHRRHATAVVVTNDLAASLTTAGLDPSLLEPLDEALGTRSDVPPPRAGSVLRLIADATYVAGRFDRYDELVAFEYRSRPDATPLRLYHLRDPKTAKTHGWFDGKGHAPIRAKWRMPLAFARITSRFNLHRLHPVLHVVMPHNGCDFAASPGTPVYSIGAGVVEFRGDAGPSGNLVTVMHEGGISSGYAHLSRFAPGIVAGTHVEARTLIGYSGTTGRSTGPHLHLSVKKNGVFIDPLSLKLDGFRVVPPSERNGFGARKLAADQALDAIALPKVEAPPPDKPAPEDDTPGE